MGYKDHKGHHPDLQEIKSLVIEQEKRVKSSICSVAFFSAAVKTISLVLFYYVFSIGLTFYNQHLFHNSGIALSVTLCHFVFKFVASGFVRWLLECKQKKPRIMLEWGPYLKRVALAGIVSSIDIGLSNWSFEFITVSLYVMSKSTSVIFILIFSLFFKLERCKYSLVFVVIFIFSGLFLFTIRSTQFNFEGFCLVMTASFLSGLRFTLSQIAMQKNEIGLHNPVDMMYHIQPWMIVALFPLAADKEGMTISTSSHYFNFTDSVVLLQNLALVLVGAMLGFLLEFSEFLLLSQTSSLTLSIAGIFKELCTMLLAVVFNKDEMTLLNAFGLFVCIVGIMVHVITKAIDRNEDSLIRDLRDESESIEMLGRNGDANVDSDDSEVDLFSKDRDR